MSYKIFQPIERNVKVNGCKLCKRHFYIVTTIVQNQKKKSLTFYLRGHDHKVDVCFLPRNAIAFLQHLNTHVKTKIRFIHNTSTMYNTDTHERKNNRHFARHKKPRNGATYGWNYSFSLGYCATSTLNYFPVTTQRETLNYDEHTLSHTLKYATVRWGMRLYGWHT